jgi:hypothetical protein
MPTSPLANWDFLHNRGCALEYFVLREPDAQGGHYTVGLQDTATTLRGDDNKQ